MKKGLLLSIVASTVLFAGGDIAPVEPVAEAPAAACDAFCGKVAATYTYEKADEADGTSTFDITANLGVSKEIFSGLTLTVGLKGSMGYDVTNKTRSEEGGITELSLAYQFCNTAIKVGRFATKGPVALVAGGIYEGVVVANTDIPDTVVMAAYLYNKVTYGGPITTAKANTIAAGLTNTSFADTTINLAASYSIDDETYTIAGTIDKKWCDTDLSIGAAYAKGGAYLVGATVQQNFGSSYLKVGATYSSDFLEFAKYTDFTGQTADDTYGIGAKLGTDWCGYKLYVDGNYQSSKTWSAGVGVAKTVSGFDLSLDYDYNSKKTHKITAKAVYKF